MNFIQIADVQSRGAPEAGRRDDGQRERRSGIVFTKSLTSVRKNRLTYADRRRFISQAASVERTQRGKLSFGKLSRTKVVFDCRKS